MEKWDGRGKGDGQLSPPGEGAELACLAHGAGEEHAHLGPQVRHQPLLNHIHREEESLHLTPPRTYSARLPRLPPRDGCE